MYTVILILHLVSAIALIGIVLLQAGKGGGLSGAFGSGMGSETLFGSSTGDMLTRATAIVATIFLTSALGLAYLSTREGSSVAKEIRQQQKEESQTKQQMQVLQELLKQQQAEEAAKKAVEEPVKAEEGKEGQPSEVKPPPLLPADAME